MKKNVLVLLFAFMCVMLNAQILSYNLDSAKEYDNNTRTAYLTLIGTVPIELHPVIQREILANPNVLSFSFYDNTNPLKCMFSSESSVNEMQIVENINEIILNNSSSFMLNNSQIQVENLKEEVLKFTLTGSVEEAQRLHVVDVFSKYSWVKSVDINADNVCKMVLYKDANITEIERIFKELGVETSLITNR
jgi:hypothetical protein